MLPSTILKVQHSNLELKSDIDSRLGILTCPDISRRWSCCKSSDRRMNKCFSFGVSSHDAKDICVIVNVFSYGFLFFQNLYSLSIKSIQCAFSNKSIQCATQEVHNMEGCLFIKKSLLSTTYLVALLLSICITCCYPIPKITSSIMSHNIWHS